MQSLGRIPPRDGERVSSRLFEKRICWCGSDNVNAQFSRRSAAAAKTCLAKEPHHGNPYGNPWKEDVSMKLLAASAFALGLGLMAITASQAMPAAPLGQTPAGSGDIIHVAQGCGPGWHRGPYGHCRRLFRCPPGWHTGRYGHRCFRNRW
jgi:hypothetical protein